MRVWKGRVKKESGGKAEVIIKIGEGESKEGKSK